MKRFFTFAGTLSLALGLGAATVTKDICYMYDPGTADYAEAQVAIAKPTTWTWSDDETGATTVAGTLAVMKVASDKIITDWIGNSLSSRGRDYQVNDIDTPTKFHRIDTVSLLLVDNNANDDVAVYGYTNNGSVTFDGTTYKDGTHSAYFDRGLTAGCIYSSTAITETILMVQFWMRVPTGHGNDGYVISTSGNQNLQLYDHGLRIYNDGQWSPYQAISDDTWYLVIIKFTGSNTILRVQDVNGALVGSERTNVGTTQPTNVTWYIGNHNTLGNNEMDGRMDTVRLSTAIMDNPPTIGDHE